MEIKGELYIKENCPACEILKRLLASDKTYLSQDDLKTFNVEVNEDYEFYKVDEKGKKTKLEKFITKTPVIKIGNHIIQGEDCISWVKYGYITNFNSRCPLYKFKTCLKKDCEFFITWMDGIIEYGKCAQVAEMQLRVIQQTKKDK